MTLEKGQRDAILAEQGWAMRHGMQAASRSLRVRETDSAPPPPTPAQTPERNTLLLTCGLETHVRF